MINFFIAKFIHGINLRIISGYHYPDSKLYQSLHKCANDACLLAGRNPENRGFMNGFKSILNDEFHDHGRTWCINSCIINPWTPCGTINHDPF